MGLAGMTGLGTLRAVGVGPGDPELMTLKAHRLIGAAPVIAYPVPNGGTGLARKIAAGAIRPGTEEIAFDVPMATERAPAQRAYDAAAERIAAPLSAGRDVALLCEGDPLFYGSAMYLLARLSGRFPTESIPGVSSLGAAGAALGQPLVARNAVLSVLPGPLPDAALRPHLETSGSTVLLKVGRHLARLRSLLDDTGLAATATYVERASHAGGRVLALADAPDPAPYFSMIVTRREVDPWLI